MEAKNPVDLDMYFTHREFMYAGGKAGIPEKRVLEATAVLLAVESGNVALPADQDTIESYFGREIVDLDPILQFMDAYPDFVPIASAYAMSIHSNVFYLIR